jgi:hypothetical protein
MRKPQRTQEIQNIMKKPVRDLTSYEREKLIDYYKKLFLSDQEEVKC